MSDSNPIVFVPRYDRNWILWLNVAPFVSILLMLFGAFRVHRDRWAWLFFLSGPAVVWLYSQKARRIRFEDAIIIERPRFPTKRIEYSWVTGTSTSGLRTTEGIIRTAFWLNDDEFDDAIDECLKRGYLTEAQLEFV